MKPTESVHPPTTVSTTGTTTTQKTNYKNNKNTDQSQKNIIGDTKELGNNVYTYGKTHGEKYNKITEAIANYLGIKLKSKEI